ncbi:MAG: DUF3108 domain-containing protein [Rhodocyclaceae bacterium]|nr:DUF3108 domain-containing protein [Rhodocyclaceae bacterium]
MIRWFAFCFGVALSIAAPAETTTSPSAAGFGAVNWPASGRIVFRVYHGDTGLQLGRTTHHWQHAAGRYQMESLVETTGLAALFKNFRYLQRSEGTVTAAGLRPDRFSVDQKGKPLQHARFDWDRAQVFIDRGDSHREAPLAAGDQDVLSVWHQLARTPQMQSLTVVSNKSAAVSLVRDLGSENVALPLGTVKARHLSIKSDDGSVKLDLWLAEGQHLLPVRIRIEDRKGEVLDQQAERIELGAPKGGS